MIEVRLLLTSVSSFQIPTLAVTGYNIDEGKDSFCQSSDECDLIYFSVSEEFFLGISVQELFKVALSLPLVFLSQA